jgi:putative ABC transport system ATP-binding protein
MILKLTDVYKGFLQGVEKISVLKGLNLEVKEAETVAILGPSGSGKTTLLSLITSLDSPDSGTIEFNNQSLQKLSEEERTTYRAQNVGIVFQQYHLINYLTAFENVALPLEILGLGDIENKVNAALKAVGLDGRKNHFPYQLSGGENQRVAIARAMITQPKMIVADEPSGSLDEKTGRIVMDYLFSVQKETNTTLLLVTHNEQLAQRCDRIINIHEGRLQESTK